MHIAHTHTCAHTHTYTHTHTHAHSRAMHARIMHIDMPCIATYIALYIVCLSTYPRAHTGCIPPSPTLQVVVGVQPDQQFIKVVYDELVELMGSKGSKDLEQGFPQVILMAGLQVGGHGCTHTYVCVCVCV